MSNVNADATQLLTILKNMRTSISSIETTRSSVKILNIHRIRQHITHREII